MVVVVTVVVAPGIWLTVGVSLAGAAAVEAGVAELSGAEGVFGAGTPGEMGAVTAPSVELVAGVVGAEGGAVCAAGTTATPLSGVAGVDGGGVTEASVLVVSGVMGGVTVAALVVELSGVTEATGAVFVPLVVTGA